MSCNVGMSFIRWGEDVGHGAGYDLRVFPKIRGKPWKTPQIVNVNRVFHYKPYIFGGVFPLFLVQHPF